MNTVRVNGTQLTGIALGLLVVVAGILVSVMKFGADIPLINVALYALLGTFAASSLFVLSRD